ncbi:MAG: hypothetical protein AAF518_18510, partial [Spirochaetota bacterium]
MEETIKSTGNKKLELALKKTAVHIDYHIQNYTKYSLDSGVLDSINGLHIGPPKVAHAEAPYIHLGVKRVSSIQGYRGSHPVISGEKMIVTRGDKVLAYNKDSGKQLWVIPLEGDLNRLGGSLGSSPSLA